MVATLESPQRFSAFLTEIAGVYHTDKIDRYAGTVALVIMVCVIPLVFAIGHVLAAAVAAILVISATIAMIDAWTTTVVVSAEGITKSSWVHVLDFTARTVAIRQIEVRRKESRVFLDVDYDSSKQRRVAIPSIDSALILAAAGVPDEPLLAQQGLAIISAAAAGAGIGFAGGIIAGPLYSEVGHAAGVMVACFVIPIATVVVDLVVRTSIPAVATSRPWRMLIAGVALLTSSAVLLTLLSAFAR